MRSQPRVVLLPLAGLLLAAACDRCDVAPIADIHPRLVVDPEEVHITNAPVAQDTFITVTLSNPSAAELSFDLIDLDRESGDPNFRILDAPVEVGASLEEEVRIAVRPRVIGNIRTTLILDAQDDALPAYVEVPILVEAVDLGLPDIEVEPAEIDFGRIGQHDVARATITVTNVGVRDLIFDRTEFIPDVEGEEAGPIRVITPLGEGYTLPPAQSQSLQLVFAPEDTELHSGVLEIETNDPDERVIRIPVRGKGSLCPVAVAELLDDPEGIEPLDTVRMTAEGSYAQSDEAEIASYAWRLVQRPVGSTAILEDTESVRTQLTVDIAGDYVIRLEVTDSDEIRSCNDATIQLHVEPSEDLHIQLVWDHATADLDLHLLREGGHVFTHAGDVYFSNREPQWFEDPAQNPTLDADDNRGYGPENINIEHPAPGSRWRVFVHYWNKQTYGDAFTVATLRIYAYGQLVADIAQSFESDETLWRALEIVWTDDPDGPNPMPTINQIGQMEPYPRPF